MSKWRAMADDALHGRDTRDKWDNSSPDSAKTGPSVSSVPSVPAPLTLLRSWCSAIEALDPCEPRPGFTMSRWQRLYDASVWWIEGFGRQAALDGWGTSDIFGLVRQMPDYGGLIDQLGDDRGLVMTADEARWRWRGIRPQVYRRGAWPNLEPFWSVEL
jgi:hypothetical protein